MIKIDLTPFWPIRELIIYRNQLFRSKVTASSKRCPAELRVQQHCPVLGIEADTKFGHDIAVTGSCVQLRKLIPLLSSMPMGRSW